MMVWEGIEVLPVVNDHAKLIGMISRQDVLKALQMIQKQPQVGEKLDDVVSRGFKETETEKPKTDAVYQYEVSPQMTNQLGNISYGVFTQILIESANRFLKSHKRRTNCRKSFCLFLKTSSNGIHDTDQTEYFRSWAQVWKAGSGSLPSVKYCRQSDVDGAADGERINGKGGMNAPFQRVTNPRILYQSCVLMLTNDKFAP